MDICQNEVILLLRSDSASQEQQQAKQLRSKAIFEMIAKRLKRTLPE